uniref:Peroxisome biogenesis protein 3-2 n=1 Tax=Lygus hesperus TaxID=30085 RepID=A0A0A9WCD8_LYGHE
MRYSDTSALGGTRMSDAAAYLYDGSGTGNGPNNNGSSVGNDKRSLPLPIPITIERYTGAIKSLRNNNKEIQKSSEALHNAKAKLKKQELKDNDQQTVEIAKLQAATNAHVATLERSEVLYTTQLTHFVEVEMKTFCNDVIKAMEGVFM